MSVMESTAPVARSRKRPVARSSKPQIEKPIKIGLHLSPESWRRLGVASTMEHRTQSQIVDELIRVHLRRWVIQERSTRPGSEALPTTEIGHEATA